MKILFSRVYLVPILVSVVSLCQAQDLTGDAYEGSIIGLQKGTTYRCMATLYGGLQIYPNTDGEEGTPLIISIKGIPLSRVMLRFTLPSLLYGDAGGVLPCMWDSTGLLWEEAGRYFDPRIPLTVDIGADSFAFMDLGIIIPIPSNAYSGSYTSLFVFSAVDSTTGDSASGGTWYTAEVQDSPAHGANLYNGSVQNLSKGCTYRLDPQHGTVQPVVNGNESGTPIVVHLITDSGLTVRTSLLLPMVLTGPSGQTISCSFDSASLFWGEDSMQLNPDSINRWCLPVDSAGSLTLKLGITVNIPPGVPSGDYTGPFGVSMSYCGFKGKRGGASMRILQGATYTVTVVGANSLLDAVATPREYGLEQNYPNPFNPSTVISYSLPRESDVQLKIFDVLGREVTTLVSGRKPAGEYTIRWDAANVPGGLYFYRVVAGSWSGVKKMLIVR